MKYRYNCSAYIFESKVIKNEILDPALKGCLSRDNVVSKLSHIALYEINTILNTRVQIALKDLKEKEERSQRTELLNVLCRGYHASGPFYENEEPEPKRKLSGFNKPTHISVELASFLGQDPNVQVARTSVTQALSAYVNAHTLKDPSDGRIIRADHKLSKLLNLRSGDTLTFFNLQRYLKPHFIKVSELNSPAGHEIEDVASNRTAVLNPVYDPTPDSPIASLSKAPESASAASPPRMPRIVAIPASDVAAAIDRNPYRASSDLRTDLKRRYISSVLNGSNKLEQKVQFTSTHTSHVSELDAVQVIPQRAEPRQQLQNALRIILNEPAANGDSTSQQRLLMALEQKHKMSLASLASSVSARILKQRQQSPQLTQFQDLYTLPICTVGDTQFVVRGRINRLEVQQESTTSTPNGDVSVAAGTDLVLAETKQRLHKLFNALRSYEEIQLQTYFQMLPNSIQRAKVTEHFLQESKDHVVLRDDRVWQEQLHPALIKFCVALRNDMALGTEGEPVNDEAREMNAYAHKI